MPAIFKLRRSPLPAGEHSCPSPMGAPKDIQRSVEPSWPGSQARSVSS